MTRLLLVRDSSVPDDPWDARSREALGTLVATARRVASGDGADVPGSGPMLEQSGRSFRWSIDVDGKPCFLSLVHRGDGSDPDSERAFLSLRPDAGNGHPGEVPLSSVEMHGVRAPVRLALRSDLRTRVGRMADWIEAMLAAPARGDLVEDGLARQAGLAALLAISDRHPERFSGRKVNGRVEEPKLTGVFRPGSPWLPPRATANSLRSETHLPPLPHLVVAGPSPTLRVPSIECWSWDCAWQVDLPHDAMSRMRSEIALTELSALASPEG